MSADTSAVLIAPPKPGALLTHLVIAERHLHLLISLNPDDSPREVVIWEPHGGHGNFKTPLQKALDTAAEAITTAFRNHQPAHAARMNLTRHLADLNTVSAKAPQEASELVIAVLIYLHRRFGLEVLHLPSARLICRSCSSAEMAVEPQFGCPNCHGERARLEFLPS